MSKTKILFLTYYKFPCDHPVLKHVFAKELAKEKEIYFIFNSYEKKEKIEKWYNAKAILVKKKGNFAFSKIIEKILYLKCLNKWIKKIRFEIVFVRDMPLLTFLLIIASKFFDFKVFYQHSAPQGDIHIAFSKTFKGFLGVLYFLKGIVYNFFLFLVLKYSKIVFPISQSSKNQIAESFHRRLIVPLPMGANFDKISNIQNYNRLKDNRIWISYFGSLAVLRNPKFIIDSFKIVSDLYPNCFLLMIGQVPFKKFEKELFDYCDKLKVSKKVYFTGFVKQQKLKRLLSFSYLSLCAIPPKKFYQFSSPTKLYESLGLGLPVIANRGIFEQEKVIFESKGGLIVDYEPNEFAKGIIYLIENKFIRNTMAVNGMEYIKRKYSYVEIAKSIYPFFS